MERPTEQQLDVEAPNESAPGHDLPDPSEVPPPSRGRETDADAPNESAPGRHEDPATAE